MSKLGAITIPAPSVNATAFPLKPDYQYSFTVEPNVTVHRFGALDAKIEQRFTQGDGTKKYVFRKAAMSRAERQTLVNWWAAGAGALSQFTFNRPNNDGTTTAVTCRFADQSFSLEAVAAGITSTGITLLEVPTGGGPSYSITSTVTRGPISGGLATGLLDQVQTLIPLLTIQPVAWQTSIWGTRTPYLSVAAAIGDSSVTIAGVGTATIPAGSQFSLNDVVYTTSADAAPSGGAVTLPLTSTVSAVSIANLPIIPQYPAITISDRLCTVGGVTYQPRLLDWDGIQQSIGGAADQASFVLGNADRVISKIANGVDLKKADVQFSLYHVNTSTLIQLWRGHVLKYSVKPGPEFPIQCADGIYELNLPYPIRKISRTCLKAFNRAELGCPYASAGSGGDPTSCDKGFDTANGCLSHGMAPYFGGIVGNPQSVQILDNSTGVAGFGRDRINSTSQIADSVYDQVVPEVFIDWVVNASDPLDATKGIPVNAKIIEGREESDFYVALGIVSEGPISYPSVSQDSCQYFLDNQTPHGWPKSSNIIRYSGSTPWGVYGLRRGDGHDPAQNNDPDGGSDQFSLSQGGSGPQSFGTGKAGGTAFCEIRRSDTPGVQPSTVESHSMQVPVRYGLPCWSWQDAGGGATNRVQITHCDNPVWIAVNAYLKGRGIYFAPKAVQEGYFDVAAAMAAATLCDTTVSKIIGTGTAPQFKFTGVLQEAKALRQWLQEILNNCLGVFSFSFGKLVIDLRINSSAVEAFEDGNVVFQSVQFDPISSTFNHLTIYFADEEFGYAGNSVSIYNEDHAIISAGASGRPEYVRGELNLAGVTTKDQAGRLASVRLCEEIGGIDTAQFAAARQVSFKTTALALNVRPGMVCSLTVDDCPDYPAQHTTVTGATAATPTYIEFRVTSWKLNKDFSITITGKTTNWDTYDVTVGPKPADVPVTPALTAASNPPADWGLSARSDQDGTFWLENFTCVDYASAVVAASADIYYCPEETQTEMFSPDGVADAVVTSIDYGTYGTHPVVNEWIQMDAEIMLVTAVTVVDEFHGTVTVVRGQCGTTAAAHPRIANNFIAVSADWKAEFTVPSGLAIYPGGGFVSGATGAGEEGVVAEYNPATGLLRTTLPLTTPAAGGPFLVCPVMRRIVCDQRTINFPPRFFASNANATFGYQVPLPFAGVAAIQATLVNSRGLTSSVVTLLPASETLMTSTASDVWPFAMRSLGGSRYSYPMSAMPAGEFLAAWNQSASAAPQSFEAGWAQTQPVVDTTTGDYSGPVAAPQPSADPVLTGPASAGSITITHAASGWEQVALRIGGYQSTWRCDTNLITSSSTLAQIASSMAAWWAADTIGQFYSFSASGAVISITDSSGKGGSMTVINHSTNPYDGTSVGVLNFSTVLLAPPLGVTMGRRYAFAFTGTISGTPFRTDLSQWTGSTGPSGPYAGALLQALPTSADPRVTGLEIYACADGHPVANAVWRLITSLSAGTADYTDTMTETTLSAAGAYPGPSLPSGSGDIRITLTRNGGDWVQMRVPPGGSKSNVIPGAALFALPGGSLLSADLDNETGTNAPLLVIAD
jgi:hypothetical protein